MMNTYTVKAEVNSEKFGKGQLVAHLNEEEIVEYANLTDKDRLEYLKKHGASFQVDVNALEDKDIAEYKVASATNADIQNGSSTPRVTRKMRMNINGQDTGWVDVTEENEEQYNSMLNQFNDMHQRFNDRFNSLFDLPPRRMLGFGTRQRLNNTDKETDTQTETDNTQEN
ncbi:hypothetical protein [Fundicoccus culcitae]|uniref:Uncharacterized protein n=1 Tax=Fundicoccus culcitae TaxID=2969821 RepID=A0ABY5P9H7_9LACT|nr:hypothetical protein [Fundicoccus culcitae]UUX35073.1 hypothetical protein NRE15_05370 [Fundicoccus culcitae]